MTEQLQALNGLLEELVEEQPVLERPPLKVVLCQLRFQQILGLGDTDVRPVQKALATDYPVLEQEEGHELLPGPEGLKPTGKVLRTYRFRDTEGHWLVTLTPVFVSLEATTKYAGFKDFARRWLQVVQPVVTELDITIQDRLGLRYVNHLECSAEPTPDELRGLVRDDLVAIVGAHARTSRLLESLQEARFRQDDGICTVRTGLVQDPPDKKFYLLDFDYYDPETKALDLREQLRSLVAFNHGIYELFSWAVTQETLDSFQPRQVKVAADG